MPGSGLAQHILPASGDDDVRSAGRELGRRLPPEVRPAARDERHLAVEHAGREDGRIRHGAAVYAADERGPSPTDSPGGTSSASSGARRSWRSSTASSWTIRRRHVVLVHGPGGIGKSTLLREVARRGAKAGFTPHVVDGRDLAPAPGEIERAVDGVERAEAPAPAVRHLRAHVAPPAATCASACSRPARAGRRRPRRPQRRPRPPGSRAAGSAWPSSSSSGRWTAPTRSRSWSAAASPRRQRRRPPRRLGGGLAARALARRRTRRARRRAALRARRLDEPNLMRTILRRVAETELDGGNFDVAAVAAIARVTDARCSPTCCPRSTPPRRRRGCARARSPSRRASGVTLHDLVRRAMRADLRASDPRARGRLRRAIADHLHARATRGEPRLVVDLAELVENPALRWGFGAEGSVAPPRRRGAPRTPSRRASSSCSAAGDDWWWKRIEPLLRGRRPTACVVVRDATAGSAASASRSRRTARPRSPRTTSCWARGSRTRASTTPATSSLLWRDAIDFTAPESGDVASPVLASSTPPRSCARASPTRATSYLPIDPRNEAAVQFAAGVGAVHHARARRALRRPRHRMPRPRPRPGRDRSAASATPIHARDGVRWRRTPRPTGPSPSRTCARRCATSTADRPRAPARWRAARRPEERAGSVRRAIEAAMDGAFGSAPDDAADARGSSTGPTCTRAASHELAAARAQRQPRDVLPPAAGGVTAARGVPAGDARRLARRRASHPQEDRP